MIYITQGYEKSIGLEVFLKSFQCLSKQERNQIKLITNKSTFKEYLNLLNWRFELPKLIEISENSYQTSVALMKGLELIKSKDVLFTLPSIKSEFKLGSSILAGHTEFFRTYYRNNIISMCFESDHFNALLITDHLPLKEVPSALNSTLIIDKVKTVLHKYDEFYFSGLNPHCGENGLLGNEDEHIIEAISELKKTYPKKSFCGPISGDVVHNYRSKDNLTVYMFHDQALSVFKAMAKGLSTNVSYGLEYPRLSVDHGTACDIYGKNIANYQSCFYSLKKALRLNHERN